MASALFAVLLLTLLAGCGGSEDPGEAYPGSRDTPFPLGNSFILNVVDIVKVNDVETRRYKNAMFDVTLELNDASIIPTFEERLYRIREIVGSAVRGEHIDELLKTPRHKAIEEDLAEKINAEFNTTAVARVCISDFVFQ
jgi:flagellar basal body-associated protein FliL